MPLRDSTWQATKPGHRTNSLGSAKVDCHTCIQLGSSCDRQRPRCGTCITNHRDCAGFTMNLVWKDPKRSAKSRKSSTIESDRGDSISNEPGPKEGSERQFKFVSGRRRARRRPQPPGEVEDHSAGKDDANISIPSDGFFVLDPNGSTSKSVSVIGGSSPSTNFNAERVPHENDVDGFASYDIPSHTPWAQPRILGLDPNFMHMNIEPTSPDQLNSSEELFQDDLDTLACDINFLQATIPDDTLMEFNSHTLTDTEQTWVEQFPLSAGVQFRDVAHKFDPILTLYNEEFCVLPLTSDCRINPFRNPENGCEGSDFLAHAILAISTHHLSKRDNSPVQKAKMHDHQSMAIQLFSKALFRSSSSRLLDALLILVNFQATQSAFGTWNVHLLGAQKILEGMGVKEICHRNPRIRAQVAVLVWWDVTIALISRREPLLPEAYLQTIMEYDRCRRDGWTFFILNGCPADLALAMRRLARLASIYEKASRMEWTTFNTTPVDLIIKEVTQWKNDEDVTADEAGYFEDDMDGRRDRFHCVEAWRYAILLYARRVFVQRQDPCGLRSISFLAREILDHIRCISCTVSIQKQTLLPIFLAGAESGDEGVHDFVREYCRHWSLNSGHFMFNTVATLLESIWAEWDVSNRDVYWWGVKVNNTRFSSTSEEQLPVSELLLG